MLAECLFRRASGLWSVHVDQQGFLCCHLQAIFVRPEDDGLVLFQEGGRGMKDFLSISELAEKW
jgi:hypothetical protein